MKILHCHSTFSLGGKEARAVRLMNVFGDAAEHVILSAMPDALGARDAIDPCVRVSFPGEAAPPLYGKPSPARYDRLSRYMQQFDLVLTYNWGSMDAVAARRMFAGVRRLPRLIHHEDGFNVSESERLNTKRNLFRRLMLPAAERLVVPSQRLESIARDIWKQPAARVLRIPNGIDVGFYSNAAEPNSIPGFVRKPGDIVVGTIAGLRGVKNLPRLVRAVAAQPPHVKLVIVGEGPERVEIGATGAVLIRDIQDVVTAEERDRSVVSFLIDHSGSMRGLRMISALLAVEGTVDALQSAGIATETLGFTTTSWKGGLSRQAWRWAGKPANPGRLCDLRHIVYADADSTVRHPWHLRMALRSDLLHENIDGEALMWAAGRLNVERWTRRVICLVSDGVPIDDSTLLANEDQTLLTGHLEVVEQRLRKDGVVVGTLIIGRDYAREPAFFERASEPREAGLALMQLVRRALLPF